MSHFKKIKRHNIQDILKRKLYVKDSFSLEKLLRASSSRNFRLRLYKENKEQNFLSNNNYDIKKPAKNSETIINSKQSVLDLNESIINLFNKADYFKSQSKEKYEECKKLNQIFYKGFQKFNKIQKEKEKKFIKKRNNSAIVKPQNFNFLDDIIKKYKERDGIIYSKELFNNKDIYAETPIVATDKDRIRYYYLYNYNKYAKKTNLNVKNILKGKKILKSKNKEPIQFEKLAITNFYNKLINTTIKSSYELENKELPNNENLDYNYYYIGDKQIKTIREIPKLKEEIKNLEHLYNKMQKNENENDDNNMINTNTTDNFKTLNITHKNFFKKININNNNINNINNNNESLNETSKDLLSTKRSAKGERKFQTNKSLINAYNKKSTLSPISQKKIFYKKLENNRNKKKNKLFSLPFSSTQKRNIFNVKQIKGEKEITSPKTKTTFYSVNNKEKFNLSCPDYLNENQIFDNKTLNDTEKAYEGLKRMTIMNKEIVLGQTENLMKSKGFNVNVIKKGIKKIELFQFFHNVKNKIDNYNCKKRLNELSYKIGRRIPDNINENLKQISDLDQEISKAEKQYYVSLFKLKN